MRPRHCHAHSTSGRRKPALLAALSALVFALLLAGGRPAFGDIQQEEQRHSGRAQQQARTQPPIAVPQQVSLNPGERLEIILSAHGQAGKLIDFILRDKPAHGTLTDYHQLTRTTASVTYTHKLADGSGADAFTYAVQAHGTAVSTPATVGIEIIEPEPHVVASPAEIDFGAVNVGEVSQAEIVLENRGGGVAVGRVEPPPPWVVDGSANYRLPKGERQAFRLVFHPRVGRSFSDFVRIGTESDQSAHLFGAGIGSNTTSMQAQEEAAASGSGGNGIGSAAGAAGAGSNAGSGPNAAGAGPGQQGSQDGSAAGAAGGRGARNAATASQDGVPAQPGTGAADEQSTNPTFAALNDAVLGGLQLRDRGRTTLTVAWRAPQPPAQSYRMELRYLSFDENKVFHVDWRPYPRTEFHVEHSVVTATLSGLSPGTHQTLRAVAVDPHGNLSAPSPILQTDTLPPWDLLRVTPLRVLFLALAVCLWMMWRRKRLERLLAEETTRRRAAEKSLAHSR